MKLSILDKSSSCPSTKITSKIDASVSLKILARSKASSSKVFENGSMFGA